MQTCFVVSTASYDYKRTKVHNYMDDEYCGRNRVLQFVKARSELIASRGVLGRL